MSASRDTQSPGDGDYETNPAATQESTSKIFEDSETESQYQEYLELQSNVPACGVKLRMQRESPLEGHVPRFNELAPNTIYLSEHTMREAELYNISGLLRSEARSAQAEAEIVAVDWRCFASRELIEETLVLLYAYMRHLRKLQLVVSTKNALVPVQCLHNTAHISAIPKLIRGPGHHTVSEVGQGSNADNQNKRLKQTSITASSQSRASMSNHNFTHAAIQVHDQPLNSMPTNITNIEGLRYDGKPVHWSTIGNLIHETMKSNDFWHRSNELYRLEQIPTLRSKPDLPIIEIYALHTEDHFVFDGCSNTPSVQALTMGNLRSDPAVLAELAAPTFRHADNAEWSFKEHGFDFSMADRCV